MRPDKEHAQLFIGEISMNINAVKLSEDLLTSPCIQVSRIGPGQTLLHRASMLPKTRHPSFRFSAFLSLALQSRAVGLRLLRQWRTRIMDAP
jgi:hypothetical protein